MLANGLGQIAERAEATARGPSHTTSRVQLRQAGGWRKWLGESHADSSLDQVWCTDERDFYVALDALHSDSKRCRASSNINE